MNAAARSSRRTLLLAVAGAMSASAALAIGILLFGDFGGTEGRILVTTMILAAHGALAVPSAMLHDQRRFPGLALAGVGVIAAAAALNVVGVWWNVDSEGYARLVGTLWALVLPTVVVTALAVARRRHRLFLPSVGLAYLTAAMAIAAIWTGTENEAYFRALGALVVLTVLLVALQPVLLRAQGARAELALRLVDESGDAVDVVVEAESTADAVARAIRDAERQGRRVHSVELPRR